LLDDLDGLADLADVTGFPRHEPYKAARRAGIRCQAIIKRLYAERARKADTLDQLHRAGADAAEFAASVESWLDQIAELRAELEAAELEADLEADELGADELEDYPAEPLPPTRRRAAPLVPGYVAPDPYWRQNADAAYWSQFTHGATARQPATVRAPAWFPRYRGDTGSRPAPAALARRPQ